MAACPSTQPLRHATTRNRVTVEHKCPSSSLQLRDRCVSSTDLSLPRTLARRTLTLQTTRLPLSVSLTIPQASGPRASMLQLSLTIVLSRRQPSQRLCSSRSVMDCLGTDNLSQPRGVQPSTLPLVSKTAVPAHQLHSVQCNVLRQTWARHIDCLLSHAQLAQRACLSLPSVAREWRCNKSRVFQRQSRNQCIHMFGIWSIRESRFVPSYRLVQKHTFTTGCWTSARQALDLECSQHFIQLVQ